MELKIFEALLATKSILIRPNKNYMYKLPQKPLKDIVQNFICKLK